MIPRQCQPCPCTLPYRVYVDLPCFCDDLSLLRTRTRERVRTLYIRLQHSPCLDVITQGIPGWSLEESPVEDTKTSACAT
jgi:hypothetical protein